MIIDFDEILDDLEVKRASLLPPGELPRIDVAAAIASLDADGLDAARDRRADGDERAVRRCSSRRAGSPTRVATLAAARDEEPDERGRRRARARDRARGGRAPAPARRRRPGHGARPLRDRRGGADRAGGVRRREGARDAPLAAARRRRRLGRRRSGSSAAPATWSPGTSGRSRSRSARRSSRSHADPEPATRLAQRVDACARARSGSPTVADRDGPGHRPGGARARRPDARRRALHPLPRRARDAPRRRDGSRRRRAPAAAPG